VKKQRFGNVVCADIERNRSDRERETRGSGTDKRDVGRMLKRFVLPFLTSLSPLLYFTFRLGRGIG
jgi:hypothetical protein